VLSLALSMPSVSFFRIGQGFSTELSGRRLHPRYTLPCAEWVDPGAATPRGRNGMKVADLVLPVFAIIVTGWLAGWLGYISRSLADGLVHFAYNVAMPALLFVTIAQEPARSLLEWRFLFAFGGGSILCFMLVFLAVRAGSGRDVASSTMYGMAAAMTNTGFVALPILHSIYGQPAVLPAAVATVFVAAVMFPTTVIRFAPSDQAYMSSRRALGRGRIPSSYETRPLKTVLNT
jgi:predicted permease